MKFFVLFATLFLAACGPEGPSPSDKMTAQWVQEERSGGTMLLGDSITAGWPAELLPPEAYNRGVGGNNTADILNRYWLVVQERPDKLFLMAGINNFFNGTVGNIVRDIDYMLSLAEQSSPDTVIFVMSILPSTWFSNSQIADVNASLRAMAETHPGVVFIDLFPLFYDDGSVLYLPDGLHPGFEGYEVMAKAMQPYF